MTFKSYVAMVGTDMPAPGFAFRVPARRLLTRQAAPKAASAPTNARFCWSALVSTDVVSVGTDVSAVVRFRIPVKSVGATLNTPDIAGLCCSNRFATSRGARYSFAKWNLQVAVT